MTFPPSFHRLLLALSLPCGLVLPAHALEENSAAACAASTEVCITSCARFDKDDPRALGCENFCRTRGSAQCAVPVQQTCGEGCTKSNATAAPALRSFTKKADVVNERLLNGRMVEAISRGSLRSIRDLIELEGLNPTYAYTYDFNPQTRLYEGRAVRLRLSDIFEDVNELRSEEKGLDKIMALFIELGMDVTATLETAPAPPNEESTRAEQGAHTAWGPSLKQMERAKDRSTRLRAFEIALEQGLKPNSDVNDWLFEQLPQVCGRDRSQFAIQIIDLLSKHLGASLQDDLWRAGERGPETLAEVLDRMMSPGSIPRSNAERAQFATMDAAWENCALLSRRINRYLMQGS